METIKSNLEILHKIEIIEKEVSSLKLTLLKEVVPLKGKKVSLRGILKGIAVTERDISHAKKSLYGKINI